MKPGLAVDKSGENLVVTGDNLWAINHNLWTSYTGVTTTCGTLVLPDH